MLQFSFGSYLMLKGFDVKFDAKTYPKRKMHKGFLLEKVFRLVIPMADVREIKTCKLNSTLKYQLYRLYRNTGIQLAPHHLFDNELVQICRGDKNNSEFLINERILLNKLSKGNWYLEGTWLDYNYYMVACRSKSILFDFNRSIFNEALRSKTEFIRGRKNSTLIHVRRADYIKKGNTQIYNICDINYYRNSISWLNSKIVVREFFIFTDDMDWAEENFNKIEGYKFYFLNDDFLLKDYQEMFLMTYFKNFILANSTFGWWSAVLSRTDGYILYPEKWYGKSRIYNYIVEFSNNDILNYFIPQNWVPIKMN